MSIATATIAGNLTKDPELRTTGGGTTVVELSVAVNKRRKIADGEYEETVSFFDAKVFGAFAELVARKLQKGDLVTLNGRLEQSRWEAQDGTKRSKVELIVNEVSSQGMFRSKDDETAPAEAEAAGATTTAATAADDDIPF